MLTTGRVQIAVLAVSLGLLIRGSRLDVHANVRVTAVEWGLLPARLQSWLARCGSRPRAASTRGVDEARQRHARAAPRGRRRSSRLLRAADDAHHRRSTNRAGGERAIAGRRASTRTTRARFLADPRHAPGRARARSDARARLRALTQALARKTDDPRLRYFQDLVGGGASARDLDGAARHRATCGRCDSCPSSRRRAPAPDPGAQSPRSTARAASARTPASRQGFSCISAWPRSRRSSRPGGSATSSSSGPGSTSRRAAVSSTPSRRRACSRSRSPMRSSSLGLADLGTLRLTCLDINPRVVAHLERLRRAPADELILTTGVGESATTSLTADYRAYFTQLGSAIGIASRATAYDDRYGRHLRKTRPARRGCTARHRSRHARHRPRPRGHPGRRGDRHQCAPVSRRSRAGARAGQHGGDARAVRRPDSQRGAAEVVADIAAAIELPLRQARTVVIANVRNGAAIYDSMWMHRKK